MAAEKDIGKAGDKVKLDRFELSAGSSDAVVDFIIAGDRKHVHQTLHENMEKVGHSFESWTTRSIPGNRGDSTTMIIGQDRRGWLLLGGAERK